MPTEFKIIDALLDEFGVDAVDGARRNLEAERRVGGKRRRTNSTRALSRSLKFIRSTRYGNPMLTFTTDGSTNQYAGVVHDGRTPGKRQPPVDAIVAWMKEKPIRLRSNTGGFVKTTPAGIRSAAFLIARSIGKKGTVGNPYFTDAITSELDKKSPAFFEALEKEIETRLILQRNKL